MKRAWMTVVALAVGSAPGWAGPPKEEEVQGLYEGRLAKDKIEARVVAWGEMKYKVFVRVNPGTDEVTKLEFDGKTEGESVTFSGGEGWEGTWSEGRIEGRAGDRKVVLERVVRKPPTLGKKPPEGAVVLVDGKDFSEMKQRKGKDADWNPADDGSIRVPKGGMNSVRSFEGGFDLHVEFRCPLQPGARSQARGNSGVYLTNRNEIQVLDSFGVHTYLGGGCGGIYKYKDPDAFDVFSLASLPPLQWQTYDVEFRVKGGKARVTVLHNGIRIHDDFELKKKPSKGEFHFQDHGNPVRYRNIWVVPGK